MMMPSGTIDRVMIGRIAYLAWPQFPRLKSSEPLEPMPVAGSQPSSTANTMTSTMPSQ